MRLRRKPEARTTLLSHPLVFTAQNAPPGKWRECFSSKHSLLYVELGTGKGQFLAKAALQYPQINWLGVERIEEPLLHAVRKGEETEQNNLRYLWMDVKQITEAFAPHEIDRLYLHFSDPWPKKKHTKRRLTYRHFLQLYQSVLSPQGDLILKTDSETLFSFSKEELTTLGWTITEQTQNLHQSEFARFNLTTEYEEKFVSRGMPIFYLKAKPPNKSKLNEIKR